MVGDSALRKRRPKGDKRLRTRAALLAAARELVRERGYERTTMEEVARRAGMTSGAIYGNFKNRQELFVALGESYWPPVVPKLRAGSTFAEMMRAFAQAAIEAAEARREVAYGRLTGMAYALTHAEMQDRVQRVTRDSFELGAAWLKDFVGEDHLPIPAEQLVVIMHALTEGLIFQRLLTPSLVPDEAFYSAFAALAHQPAA